MDGDRRRSSGWAERHLAGNGSATTAFGRRMSRDTALYVAGMGVVFPFALAAVAVYTRYLEPAEFGRLAVLLTFAALLSVLGSVPALRGTLAWTFGGSEEEAVDDDADRVAVDRGRALTSGLLLVVVALAVMCAILQPFAATIARLLLGAGTDVEPVRWAILSGAMGMLWRLVVNVPRMERRPVVFGLVSVLRPLAVLGVAIPLLVTGQGLVSVLIGTAVGTAVAALLAITATIRAYAPRASRGDMRQIIRLGSRPAWIPIAMSVWIITNADVFFLAQLASDAETGEYRVANRIAAFGSYFVSAFLMAWAPLERSTLFQGTYQQKGRAAVGAKLTMYYVLAAVGIVLFFTLASDALIRIASEDYRSAADLVAAIGAGFACYGLFVVLARVARVPHRLRVFATLALLGAGLFCGLCLVLIPRLGGAGAALAMIVAMLTTSALFVVRIQCGPEPMPFEWGRIAGGVAIAVACALVATRSGVDGVAARVALDVFCLAAYPVLLAVLGVVPREHLAPLARIGRAALPQRSGTFQMLEGLEKLPTRRRHALELLVRDKRSLAATAGALGVDEHEAATLAIRGARQLTGLGSSGPLDGRIGLALLAHGPVANRDARMRELVAEGHEPLDLADLEAVVDRLGRSPRRAWAR